MSGSRRSRGRYFSSAVAKRIAIGILAVGLPVIVQGCSSSREGGGGSSWKLWGSDSSSDTSKQAQAQPKQAEWKQPSSFDDDGPASAPRNTYRGGRDPVSGRAQEWAPAAPPSAGPTSVSQLPPAAAPAAPAAVPYRPMPQPAGAPMRTAAAAPIAATSAGHAPTSVEVRTGDTLYRIAKAHNVTVPSLMQANGLANESIKVGQRLNIPAR